MVRRQLHTLGAALLLPALISGCSTIDSVGSTVGGWVGGDEDLFAPAELTDIVSEVDLNVMWSNSVGVGSDDLWVKLNHQISAGVVYAVSVDGAVSAFNIDSGKTLWEHQLEQNGEEQKVMAGVALGKEHLYLGMESGALVALSLSNGQQQWSVSLLSEILSPPAVADGVVVVRTVDGKLIALTEQDGKELWRYEREVPVLTLRGTGSPLIVEDRVYAGLDGGELVSLSLQDGAELWMKEVSSPRGRTEIERMADVDADPVATDDALYLISYQGDLVSLNMDGDLIWKRAMSGLTAPAVVGEYLFLADAEGVVWAFNRQDGSALWKQDGLKHRSLTTPPLAGKSLVVGDAEGYLHWISAEDGSFIGRIKADSDGVSAPSLLYGSSVISYGQSGKLSAIKYR